MFLNSLKIRTGHEDLEGYPRSWWPSTPWNPAAVAELVSGAQRPLRDTKNWWRINYTFNGRRFFKFFM